MKLEALTPTLELHFFTIAEMEEFTMDEMADQDYMAHKIAIWYEMGLISSNEHTLFQQNWGLKGYDRENI